VQIKARDSGIALKIDTFRERFYCGHNLLQERENEDVGNAAESVSDSYHPTSRIAAMEQCDAIGYYHLCMIFVVFDVAVSVCRS